MRRAARVNPLVDDRDVGFLLYEVHRRRLRSLAYPHFADHSRETFDSYVGRLPALRARDALPGLPRARRRAAGLPRRPRRRAPVAARHLAEARRARRRRRLAAVRRRRSAAPAHDRDRGPPLPDGRRTCAVYGYVGLTTGAAHLIEAFGSTALKETYHRAAVRGALDRHDGAHRAAGRLEPRGRRDARDAVRATTTSSRARRSSSPAATTTSPRTSSTWSSRASTARPPGSRASACSSSRSCGSRGAGSSPTT